MKPKKTVEQYLDEVDYSFKDYIPTEASLEFMIYVKLIEDGKLEYSSPQAHLRLLDTIYGKAKRISILCFRGFAKTTLVCIYLPLITAIKGKMVGFGDVNYMLFVLNSFDEGVKTVRKIMEATWTNSPFLQEYLPKTKFTDGGIWLTNLEGVEMYINLVGVNQKIRGTGFRNSRGLHRPEVTIIDDVLDDVEARSALSISNVEDVIYKKVGNAVNINHNKIIYIGTIFNSSDPLYRAVGTTQWTSVVFPVCERFPCLEEEFKGAWEEKFTYKLVKEKYDNAMELGRIKDFNQELMNRVMSDEDRLVNPQDIMWYDRKSLINNRGNYNFYITTDFATSDRESSDFSVISVWAYNYAGHWFWVDGVVVRQLMNKNIDDLFRFCQKYKPLGVGVEVSGTQKGFISWIRSEMISRNIMFNFATDNNRGEAGIRPVQDKLTRFQLILPMFKQNKIWFPVGLKETAPMIEALDELSKVSHTGFKSKHEDFIDTISMLYVMKTWKPSQNHRYQGFIDLDFDTSDSSLYNKGLSTVF